MDEATASGRVGDSDKLALANAQHDESPSVAADLLRSIDPAHLAESELPTFSFLLNHVLGEKLNAWREALHHHERTLQAPGVTPSRLRQAAAAAVAAGDDDAGRRLVAQFAKAMQAPQERAREVAVLAALTHSTSALSSDEAARLTRESLAVLDEPCWGEPSALDAQVAACLNNLAGTLKDRAEQDLHHVALREAVSRCAEFAHRFWSRAGTWVNVERALYLRATVASALGDLESARAHSCQALKIIDENESANPQPVDRAFLELEQSHACQGLGLAQEAAACLVRADTLAASFGEPGLKRWFESRRTWAVAQSQSGNLE